MKIKNFNNSKMVLEDSDVEDYPKSHGRPILSRLLACIGFSALIGIPIGTLVYWALITVKRLLGL